MSPIIKQKNIGADISDAVNFFAEEFVINGNYPEKISDIEISLYSIPGRDIL